MLALWRGTIFSSGPARRTTSLRKGPLFDLFLAGCFWARDPLCGLRLVALLLIKLYAIRKCGPAFTCLDATPVDDGDTEFRQKQCEHSVSTDSAAGTVCLWMGLDPWLPGPPWPDETPGCMFSWTAVAVTWAPTLCWPPPPSSSWPSRLMFRSSSRMVGFICRLSISWLQSPFNGEYLASADQDQLAPGQWLAHVLSYRPTTWSFCKGSGRQASSGYPNQWSQHRTS